MNIIFETENPTLIKSVNDFVQEWQGSSEKIQVRTSGSTGQPKDIFIQKSHMRESAKMTGHFLQLKPNDSALLCLSMDSIAGKMMVVRSIVLDLKLIVVDVNSNPLANMISSISFCAMVPIQVEKSLKSQKEKLLDINKLIIGGGVISSHLEKQLHGMSNDIYHTFGMTETISHIAMRRLNDKNSSYSALPNIEFSCKEECLVINAPTLGIKELKSNDIVNLIDSHHFEWLGRKDFVINSGGVKIHPEMVEKLYSNLFNAPFFVYGMEDVRLGSRLVLCIESERPLNIEKKIFNDISNSYYKAKEVYFFDSFQYTDSGKINRQETIKGINNAEKQML